MKRKANWENPVKKTKTKQYTFTLLKSDEIVTITKTDSTKNLLWKFYKPLKYYFLKYRNTCQLIKIKELEKKSRKYTIA